MAQLVLGIGSSHTPMLNAPPDDWPKFIELDRLRPHLDKTGRAVNYAELERLAGQRLAQELTPQRHAERHAAAMAHISTLREALREARLDTLIVVGDDQKELYHEHNLPSVLVYRGSQIRSVPQVPAPSRPEWARRASAKYYDDAPTDYPVNAALAGHLIGHLVENEFDVAVADTLLDGQGEGHAFGFVHKRLLPGVVLPVLPVFLNTYYPPNQPTPRRCFRLGQAIRTAVQSFPGDARIGIVASGGLSHFTIDEALDARVIAALRSRDAMALADLPRAQLNSGNSEIRNWICMAGAVEHLGLRSIEYIPAYRTPAGTGTGLCFGVWN